MTVTDEECKSCGRNVRIGMFILVVLCLTIGFTFGYIVGKKNLWSTNFFDYNIPMATKHFTGSKGVLDTKIADVIFNDDGQGKLFKHENVTIIIQEMDVGGYYIGGNEIYIHKYSTSIIGHELCHLILNRYGVEDIKVNEQICYTIQQNYDFVGYVE